MLFYCSMHLLSIRILFNNNAIGFKRVRILMKISGLLDKALIFRREIITIWNYYRPFRFSNSNDRFVYVSEPYMKHSGLFDKLKGIVSIYALSKIHNTCFQIHFVSPFLLSRYIVPNVCKWNISDIHFNYPSTKFVIANSIYKSPLWKKRKGETHYNYTFDVLDDIKERYGVSYDWGDLYNELFKPSDYLLDCINLYKRKLGGDFIAIHFRMVNLLGDQTETNLDFKTLPNDKRLRLMNDCLDIVHKLKIDQGVDNVLVLTDSNTFSEYLNSVASDIFMVPGVIKHIGNNRSLDDSAILKVFVDYYLISQAKYVYSIVGRGLYRSAFPEYAAKIGHRPFERIKLE